MVLNTGHLLRLFYTLTYFLNNHLEFLYESGTKHILINNQNGFGPAENNFGPPCDLRKEFFDKEQHCKCSKG